MRTIITLSVLALSLAFAAGLAFGVGETINIPWFVNDINGIQAAYEDTWITAKNVTDFTFTLTVDYYDNSDYLTIATSDTMLLVPGAVVPIYTGKPAYTYNMKDNCDRGSLVMRWPNQTPGDAQAELQGYMSLISWNNGNAQGINFVYK